MSGHKRVWAQTFVGTSVSWHKRVWAQSCGLKYVWAQTCGLRARLHDNDNAAAALCVLQVFSHGGIKVLRIVRP